MLSRINTHRPTVSPARAQRHPILYDPSMVELTRTVRFSVNEAGGPSAAATAHNSFAAHPPMTGLGRHYELDIRCRGEVDADTGYFINIKDIDRAARATLIPAIAAACAHHPGAAPVQVLRDGLSALNSAIRAGDAVAAVRWRLSPYYSLEMSPQSPTIALLRQQFEFAAAHRLHVNTLSDEENRRIFGKCNNPRGHGHNYRVEPCVEVRADSAAPFTLQMLERLTAERVINRFDHTHLNEDTAEFNTAKGGVNPSVENIAKVCFELLAPAIAAASSDARLRSVTVWETDKTSATYPG